MAKRIQLAGTVPAQGADGQTMQYRYSGSYSAPVLDRLGLLSFGWKAVVDGIDSQPEPRNVIVRTPGPEIASGFVTHRIESAIVEHLEGNDRDHTGLL